MASLHEAGLTGFGAVTVSGVARFFLGGPFLPSVLPSSSLLRFAGLFALLVEACFPVILATGAFFFVFSWLATSVTASVDSFSLDPVSESPPLEVGSGVSGAATLSSSTCLLFALVALLAALVALLAALVTFAADFLAIFGGVRGGMWTGGRGMAICETNSWKATRLASSGEGFSSTRVFGVGMLEMNNFLRL